MCFRADCPVGHSRRGPYAGAPGTTRTCDLRFRNTSTSSAGVNWEQRSPIVTASSSTENGWSPQASSRSCARNVHNYSVSNSGPRWCRVRGEAVATAGVLEPENSISIYGGYSNYGPPMDGLSAGWQPRTDAPKPLSHRGFIGVSYRYGPISPS